MSTAFAVDLTPEPPEFVCPHCGSDEVSSFDYLYDHYPKFEGDIEGKMTAIGYRCHTCGKNSQHLVNADQFPYPEE